MDYWNWYRERFIRERAFIELVQLTEDLGLYEKHQHQRNQLIPPVSPGMGPDISEPPVETPQDHT